MELQDIFIRLAYLISSVGFIVGIKMLGKTQTSRRGNQVSMLAMLLAILATIMQVDLLTLPEIFGCMLLGSAIGLVVAQRVEMTKMPELVALFNGFGGLASLTVALSEYWRKQFGSSDQLSDIDGITMSTILLSIIIGGVTFTGSTVAFGKLNGSISGKAIVFKGQHLLNLLIFIVCLAASILVVADTDQMAALLLVVLLALVLGVLTVIPIGGADMPVVISLLNSYSGIAACTTGFVLNNQVLIIAGSLVGSSGIILTQIMCKAMNRSLTNVLLGGFGQTTGAASTGTASDIVVKEVGVEEAAMIFDAAQSVIIVPGYGMAVAQAQHAVKELMDLLDKRNIDVRFAIHPVAGRMPGHMNVLLAEANVPYDKLVEMELINDDFNNCDVCLIIGANDVVNPAAKTNPSSPIYGMPVLNVEKSKTVIVSKRSMAAGYAGIDNELFGYPNCLMLFGDAKSTLTKLNTELKS
jgi:NAD(P) transhydrogenase subunit beta